MITDKAYAILIGGASVIHAIANQDAWSAAVGFGLASLFWNKT